MTSGGKQNGALNRSVSGMWSGEDSQFSDEFDVPGDLSVSFSKFVPSALNKRRITRTHWRDGDKCYNSKCGKTFPSKNSVKHCFLCGYPYCRECLVHKRRLGANAKPSPSGIECPVCDRCSQDGGLSQSLGHMFSHTEAFSSYRWQWQSRARHVQDSNPSSVQGLATSHTGKVITSQLKHLTEEFDRRRSLFLAMTTGVPDWQKSSRWPHQENAKTCHRCNKGLKAILSYKIHCRLCGLIHCSKCVQENLLLYHNSRNVSTWAIVGCNEPLQKPKKYAILPACEACLGQLQPFAQPPSDEIDGNKEGGEDDSKDEESEVFYQTLRHRQELAMKHQTTIFDSLPRYGELIDDEEEKQQVNGGKRPSEVPKELARLHCDLQKAFKDLRDTTLTLKNLQGKTQRQNILKQNVMRGCQTFHGNHVILYRADLTRIQSLLPAVNQSEEQVRDSSCQALKMVHILIMQLVMELIKIARTNPHLSGMLEESVMVHLKGIEEVVVEELEEVLVESGKTLEEHHEKASEFVREEFRANHYKYPAIPPECLHNVAAVKQHVLRFSQTHLNKCRRYLANCSAASVRDLRQSMDVIERKLLDFQSMLEFCSM